MGKNNFDVAADKTADAEFTTMKNMHIVSFVFSKLLLTLTVKYPLHPPAQKDHYRKYKIFSEERPGDQ